MSILELVGDSGLTSVNLASLSGWLLVCRRDTCIIGHSDT